MQQKNNPYHK